MRYAKENDELYLVTHLFVKCWNFIREVHRNLRIFSKYELNEIMKVSLCFFKNKSYFCCNISTFPAFSKEKEYESKIEQT